MNLPEIEALHDAFANVIRAHGDVSKALNAMLEKASVAAHAGDGYTAWMIELYEDPLTMPTGRGFVGWWHGLADRDGDPLGGWTRDPNCAIKFLTRLDAERAAQAFGLTYRVHRVTEHVWMDAARSRADGKKEDR